MNNKNIEEIDFLSLTTEEAEKLGLNAIFHDALDGGKLQALDVHVPYHHAEL